MTGCFANSQRPTANSQSTCIDERIGKIIASSGVKRAHSVSFCSGGEVERKLSLHPWGGVSDSSTSPLTLPLSSLRKIRPPEGGQNLLTANSGGEAFG